MVQFLLHFYSLWKLLATHQMHEHDKALVLVAGQSHRLAGPFQLATVMLGNQYGHNALQMLDIIALHIVPRLHAQDVQSLGHSCRQLWELVDTAVPPASWLSVASLSFPPGHPILNLDPAKVS